MDHPFYREMGLIAEIEKCQIVLETVKPPALTALFTGPVNNSAADLLDTGFASSEGGLDPQCRELVTRTVLDLVEQVVVLLRRVDWANMVGRMRAQLVQHTPGMMHVPMFLTDMEQAWHRPRSLLLLGGGLAAPSVWGLHGREAWVPMRAGGVCRQCEKRDDIHLAAAVQRHACASTWPATWLQVRRQRREHGVGLHPGCTMQHSS